MPHSGSTVTVRVKSTLSTNNNNPSLTAGPGTSVAYEYYAFDLLQIWSSPDPPIDYSSIDRGVYQWGSVDTRTVIKGYKRYGNTVTTELNLTNGFTSLDSNWWQCTSGTTTTPCPGRLSSLEPQSSMALQIPGTILLLVIVTFLVKPTIVKPSAVIKRIMHCQIEVVHWVNLVLKFMGRLKALPVMTIQ